MPIRPENRARYPKDWKATIHELFSPEAVWACGAVDASIGFNPMHAAGWWEHALASLLGGNVSAHNDEHDIELPGGLLVEVKFSRAFSMQFQGQPRRVFRWAAVSGSSGRKACPVTVLVGLDREDVHTWVIPRWAVNGTRTVTTNVPPGRGSPRSGIFAWYAPAIDLLPVVLRVARSEPPA